MIKDNTVHHPSNAKNCPQCMDEYIKRENKKASDKRLDVMGSDYTIMIDNTKILEATHSSLF